MERFLKKFLVTNPFRPMIFWTLLFLFIETPIIFIFFKTKVWAKRFFANNFSVDKRPRFGSMTFWQHFAVNDFFLTFFGQ